MPSRAFREPRKLYALDYNMSGGRASMIRRYAFRAGFGPFIVIGRGAQSSVGDCIIQRVDGTGCTTDAVLTVRRELLIEIPEYSLRLWTLNVLFAIGRLATNFFFVLRFRRRPG